MTMVLLMLLYRPVTEHRAGSCVDVRHVTRGVETVCVDQRVVVRWEQR